jgi:hypothetical protein
MSVGNFVFSGELGFLVYIDQEKEEEENND